MPWKGDCLVLHIILSRSRYSSSPNRLASIMTCRNATAPSLGVIHSVRTAKSAQVANIDYVVARVGNQVTDFS
jgi:hypothetical protein